MVKRNEFLCINFIQAIKKELEHRKELEQQARHRSTSPEGMTLITDDKQTEQSPLHSALTNLAMFFGVAIFAFTVKYVLRSIATQEYYQE